MGFIRTQIDLSSQDYFQYRDNLSVERLARLAQLHIVITGAGSGFGQAISLALAACGVELSLVGRNVDKLKQTARACKALNSTVKVNCVAIDLTRTEQFIRLKPHLSIKPLGIVHSAAIASMGRSFLSIPVYDVEQQLRCNSLSVLELFKLCLPVWQQRQMARVVLLSSEAGWAGKHTTSSYNLSKAALNSINQSLADEFTCNFPKLDMQCNVLVPGEARTKMNQLSNDSPSLVVPMTLMLLSNPVGGPNGRFFHRDGRHFSFAYTKQYPIPLNLL